MRMWGKMLLEREWWLAAEPLESSSADIFILIAFVSALTYHSVGMQFSCYPYQLASLIRPLQSEADKFEAAVCFLSAPRCCLDPFSQHLRRLFPGAKDLCGPLAQSYLHAALGMMDANTFSVEQLHSQNARRIWSRTMTARMSLHQTSVFHAGKAAPSYVEGVAEFDSTPSSSSRKHKRADDDEAIKKQQKKRKGGGGTWRAFVHLDSLSREHGVDGNFKHLNLKERYLNMSDDLRQRCEELGKQATRLHAVGQVGFSTTHVRSRKKKRNLPGDINAGALSWSCSLCLKENRSCPTKRNNHR